MTLAAGTRLGAYEVRAAVGAGGMGEVYRARDLTLQRDVALKVLPDEFAGDAERLERFTRGAKVLATLHHPNIAQIYGFDQTCHRAACAECSSIGDDQGLNYTYWPGGQRFLMRRPALGANGLSEYRVVLNWFEELKARVR